MLLLERRLVLLLGRQLELQLGPRHELERLKVLRCHPEPLRHVPLALQHQLACPQLVHNQLKRVKWPRVKVRVQTSSCVFSVSLKQLFFQAIDMQTSPAHPAPTLALC